MASFGIDIFNFVEWQGPPPSVLTDQVITHHRPGASSMAQQLIGQWGESREVTVVSHWTSFLAAMEGHRLMSLLPGSGAVLVKYGDVNWSNYYGVVYHVESVECLNIQANALLLGPGYSYPSGVALTSRFVLTPQRAF
jgi:hypothetical protein